MWFDLDYLKNPRQIAHRNVVLSILRFLAIVSTLMYSQLAHTAGLVNGEALTDLISPEGDIDTHTFSANINDTQDHLDGS